MHYDRTIIGYHGCDERVARRLLSGQPFRASDNDYDWLGRGIYFWEFGIERALRFAHDQQRRGKVRHPAIVGAVIQLGQCFDLMDTRFTTQLARAYPHWAQAMNEAHKPLPTNSGTTRDRLLRRLDCAVMNWLLVRLATDASLRPFDSVRCGFVEGPPCFPGSGIHAQSHVQLAIRNPDCIVGVFKPRMDRHAAKKTREA